MVSPKSLPAESRSALANNGGSWHVRCGCAAWHVAPTPRTVILVAMQARSVRRVLLRYLAALARSRSGAWGCGAIVCEFHGLDHEALGPTLTAGQAATNSRLLVDLRPVPPRETRRASAPIPRKRSPCPGPAQGPPRARARPAQGPLIFYGTARRILDSQGFGVLISLNLQNQGFGGPCCKT